MKRLFALTGLVNLSILITSCGGHGQPPVSPQKNTATLRMNVMWPAQTRVVPRAAQSITLVVSQVGIAVGRATIVRPANYIQIQNLPAGTGLLVATAYPNSDGSGVPQAIGSQNVELTSGGTAQTSVTMGSTVTKMSILPNMPSVSLGATENLTVSATDAAGNTVLVAPSTVIWNTDSSSVALISPSGLGVAVSGLALGTANISATFIEEEPALGQSAVVSTVSEHVVGGLANSSWPILYGTAQNTSLGKAPSAVGAIGWQTPLSGPGATVVTGLDGSVYVLYEYLSPLHMSFDSADVAAFSPQGVPLWSYLVGTGSANGIAVGSDGTIYAAENASYLQGMYSTNSTVVALNPDSSVRWKYVGASGPLNIAPDGTIYALSPDYKTLLALNPDGTKRWGMAVPTTMGAVPAVGADGTVYISSGLTQTGGWVEAVSSAGLVKWSYMANGGSLILASDGTIYVSSNQGLVALGATGVAKWTFGSSAVIADGVAADGTIYAWANSNTLVALDPTGLQKWVQPFASNSLMLASDGTIYTADLNTLTALDSGGNTKWTLQLGGIGNFAQGPHGEVYAFTTSNISEFSELTMIR